MPKLKNAFANLLSILETRTLHAQIPTVAVLLSQWTMSECSFCNLEKICAMRLRELHDVQTFATSQKLLGWLSSRLLCSALNANKRPSI